MGDQQQEGREQRAIEGRDGEAEAMCEFILLIDSGVAEKTKKPGQFGSGADCFWKNC